MVIYGSNSLQGNIPKGIGQLKNLGLLSIEENNILGILFNSITYLQQMRYLDLHMNRLSGEQI